VLFLSLEDILESHQFQIDSYGGSPGIREIGLLKSAIAQPQASFGGQLLHADVYEMAAAYLYHLVMNHPFVDGNKRVGLEAALIFLEINNATLKASDEDLVELVLKTTLGQVGKRDIAEFFRSHCVDCQ
jgi:death-on-curing protein